MDRLSSEAIASLQTGLNTLLSSVVDVTVQRQIIILPIHVHPTGLGGGLSVHPNPVGVVEGRSLEAIALINLQSQNVVNLNTIASTLVTTLITQSRSDLINQGILSIKLDSPGNLLQVNHSESGNSFYKELSFRVVYEFRKLPVESEGIIQTIPIQLATG